MTRKVYQADFGSRADQMVLSAATNPIHNGGFNIWQRGLSFASAANGTYGPDRWSYVKATTTAAHTVLGFADVPTVAALVPGATYSARLFCTTADAAVDAGDLICFRQVIEGYNFQPFAQKAFTLGFWVKATKTGAYCVSFKNNGLDRSYIGEYAVNVAETWEYKTITVPASPSAGTWDFTNGAGLYVDFTLMAGTTYQTTAGAWQTGHYYGTSNQINACDSIINSVQLWGVTMGLGTTVAPFWPRSFGEELALCQRYYWKTFPYATAPASSAGTTGSLFTLAASGPNSPVVNAVFPTRMRTTPTITTYNPGAAGAGFYDTTAVADIAVSVTFPGDSVCSIYGPGATAGHGYALHLTADAEL